MPKIPSVGRQLGFIAQEVLEVEPDLVLDPDPNDTEIPVEDQRLNLQYDSVTALLAGAIQDLTTEVRALKAELDALKASKE
jgi:hypothetical protein